MRRRESQHDAPTAGLDRQARAEDWFVRLRDPACSDIERAAFRRWLTEQPDHAEAYQRIQMMWRASAALRDRPAIATARRAALRQRAPRRQRLRWPALAAALVLMMAGGVVLSQLRPAGAAIGGERLVTATGEQRRITLTDGSSVLLDAESALRVQYDEQARQLLLERGQAAFEVVRDGRPFIVHAADGSVRALGTAFQVRVDGKAVVVTLLEGRVSVDVPGLLGGLLVPARSEILESGQALRYAGRRAPLQPAPADLEVAQAWPQGELVFRRWRLEDLVAEMNRHAEVKLRIVEPSLRGLMVSGRFRAGDQQSLLLALQAEWPIRALPRQGEVIALTVR